MGGSSSINGQVLFRGVPEDYDNWAAEGNDQWSFTDVLPYFRKLENDRDFGGDDFHGNDDRESDFGNAHHFPRLLFTRRNLRIYDDRQLRLGGWDSCSGLPG